MALMWPQGAALRWRRKIGLLWNTFFCFVKRNSRYLQSNCAHQGPCNRGCTVIHVKWLWINTAAQPLRKYKVMTMNLFSFNSMWLRSSSIIYLTFYYISYIFYISSYIFYVGESSLPVVGSRQICQFPTVQQNVKIWNFPSKSFIHKISHCH